MKQALLDALEWYAEATPKARLDDNGERAVNLLLQLNEGSDEDALTVLLKRVDTLLECFNKNIGLLYGINTDKLNALRKSAMEWSE